MTHKVSGSPLMVHALEIIQFSIQDLAVQLSADFHNNPMFESGRESLAEGSATLAEESLVADSLPRLPPADLTDLTSLHLDDEQYETLKFVEPEIEELFDLEARRADPLPSPDPDSFDPTLLPDIIVVEGDGYLTSAVYSDPLPSVRLNSRYLQLLRDPTTPVDTIEFLREHLRKGKWLLMVVEQRNHLLKRIGDLLIEEMPNYLSGATTHLLPIPVRKAAAALHVAEATVLRAIANKSVSCPAGTLLLVRLFTHAHIEPDRPPALEAIRELIAEENPAKPLSDAKVSEHLAAHGIRCARRTVARYRQILGIASTRVRRRR